ncbi:pentatricopeptide repeat-containing protein At3g02650, mitochondrial-like [Lotus japonicus]|uniref:pentatricopeptide repeat-containing protein At3g02650, mitochondrial-like n=1 Tax=Lotus japonicus TaxID=34305 RepID=UPI00258F2A9E|nr:pentatricopeptide repeat-containing protein At3g02650, mitochondrial-like [Lotus japonicus]
MWRWILARHGNAIRSYNNRVLSRIQLPLSNFLVNPPPQSTFHFPQSSYVCSNGNNPRFFCHGATDSTVDFENGVSVFSDGGVQNDDEQRAVEEQGYEEKEEEVYQIDEGKLENVVSLLQREDADGSLESSLDAMDLTLHQDFVIIALRRNSWGHGLVENLLRFFRWVWKENSSNVTTPVVESLVHAVCSSSVREKEFYSLWELVKEIGEEEDGKIIDVTILNKLIFYFSQLGNGKAALELFDKFEFFQCVPNAETYHFTIQALYRHSLFDSASSVSQKMLDAQSIPDEEKVGDILGWLCKGKKVKEAHAVYKAVVEKGKYPPMSSVNFLVGKLAYENGTVPLALEMLKDIPGDMRKHAIKPYLAVVRALCRVKDVGAAKQLILDMIANGPPPGNAVFNFVITGYSKVGEMGQAVEMMKLLESRGLKPDVYTYAVIVSGYSNGGEMEAARKILEEAKKNHSVLSPVMYHSLVRGYCKMEQFDEALKLLTEMKDSGVRISVDEYDKLIQSLCLKAMDWETAEKLQAEMKENGLYLKGVTRALIRAVKEMENEAVEP